MNKQVIAISGSKGFIGRNLMQALKDYELIEITWNDFKQSNENFYSKIEKADVIINLAGDPTFVDC